MSTLTEEFKDVEYRRAYAESFANTVIATQLRLLRGEMTQAEFAELVGMKQSRISAMEDENYASWSTKTLKEIAAKKDVVFLGRFVSFGELLQWSSRLSEEVLKVPSYANDPLANQDPITAHGTYWIASTTGPVRVINYSRAPMLRIVASESTGRENIAYEKEATRG